MAPPPQLNPKKKTTTGGAGVGRREKKKLGGGGVFRGGGIFSLPKKPGGNIFIPTLPEWGAVFQKKMGTTKSGQPRAPNPAGGGKKGQKTEKNPSF